MSDKLPPWPKLPANIWDEAAWTLYHASRSKAALARLHKASKWLELTPHAMECPLTWPAPVAGSQRRCNCGLDEFVADMLPEGEK